VTDATGPERDFDAQASGRFWDRWNQEWRFRTSHDRFMQRQLAIAIGVAQNAKLDGARILGIGCGTGWLENGLLPFGEVWGTDLSSAAIEQGSKQHPQLNLRCCDFLRAEVPGPFDLVVSADSLVPMADHQRCVERVAELLRPGGRFLLMTQNPFVWARRSGHQLVDASVPHVDPKEWPNLARIRGLLRRSFVIERVTTIDPGGDLGLLWWVENRFVRSFAGRIFGTYRWERLLEVAGLGRELVVIARRC
jgi:SAM-dependent methyltransferase